MLLLLTAACLCNAGPSLQLHPPLQGSGGEPQLGHFALAEQLAQVAALFCLFV